MVTAKGTIKWFSLEKRYGFVQDDEDGKILFISRFSFSDTNFRAFVPGVPVTFEPFEGPKGMEAANVRIINERKKRRKK